MICTPLSTSRNTELMYLTIMSLFSWLHYTDWLIDCLIESCDCLNTQDYSSQSLYPESFVFPCPFNQEWRRCKHTVCNQWVRFLSHTSPTSNLSLKSWTQPPEKLIMEYGISVLLLHPSQRSNTVPFLGDAHGRITQQKKVSVMANPVLPASAVVSPDAFFGLHSKCCLGGFFASVPWLFWLLLC